MKVPNIMNIQFFDAEGKMTPDGAAFFSQLTSELQKNFSEEGLVPPSQSTANVAVIEDAVPAPGTILIEVDGMGVQTAKIYLNGSFKTFTVT